MKANLHTSEFSFFIPNGYNMDIFKLSHQTIQTFFSHPLACVFPQDADSAIFRVQACIRKGAREAWLCNETSP